MKIKHASTPWALLTAVAITSLWAESPAAPDAAITPDMLLSRHMEAVGGRDRLANIRSQVSTFDAREGQSTFPLEACFDKAGKVAISAKLPNNFILRQGQDEHGRCWRQTPGGVQEVSDPKDLFEFVEMALCLNPAAILKLHQHFPRLAVLPAEKVDSLDCQVLAATTENGRTLKLLFWAHSGLLVRVGTSVLEDYQAEDGVKVPHKIRKAKGAWFKLKNIQFNVAIDESRFARPSAAEAVAAREQMDQLQYLTNMNPGTTLGVARKPEPAVFFRGPILDIPVFRPDSQESFKVDLRGTDVSAAPLAGRLADLLHADFDSKTVWPTNLPAGFSPDLIMHSGRNPGLGVRELHRKGLTGKGVGLAIIDQALLVNHEEYRDQLRTYEEIHWPAPSQQAQMHGPAVASLAVGKTVGVAPGADLYYIAEMHGVGSAGAFDWDFTWLARSIDRVLEINDSLPKDRKIRVISVSVGWGPGQKGCEAIDAAVERAGEAGVFVISTALERTHKLAFHGLGRDSRKDPDQYTSYGPGSWWAMRFLEGIGRFDPGKRLLVPMDARTTASPTGDHDFVFYSAGGWSWSVPYLAGLYALACEVRPDVTPELFWSTALKTGRVIPLEHKGKKLELGTVVDPVRLIDTLKLAVP